MFPIGQLRLFLLNAQRIGRASISATRRDRIERGEICVNSGFALALSDDSRLSISGGFELKLFRALDSENIGTLALLLQSQHVVNAGLF